MNSTQPFVYVVELLRLASLLIIMSLGTLSVTPTGYGYHAGECVRLINPGRLFTTVISIKDFMNGWDAGVLQKAVDNCHCNDFGDVSS